MKLLLVYKILFILAFQVIYVGCVYEGKLHLDSDGKFKIAQVLKYCYINVCICIVY